MGTYALKLGLIPVLFLVACTSTGQTTSAPAPSRTTFSSAAPTLAPISIVAPTLAPISILAEPGRDVALPVHTGSGGVHLQVRPFKGRFELFISCIGGGSATFIIGDSSSSIECNGQMVGNNIETGKVADTLTIQAAAAQSWRVAIETGHTPIE